jgi:hypothetical protein
MGKYLELLDDEDHEMSPHELREAKIELYADLFGEQAGHWMREYLDEADRVKAANN